MKRFYALAVAAAHQALRGDRVAGATPEDLAHDLLAERLEVFLEHGVSFFKAAVRNKARDRARRDRRLAPWPCAAHGEERGEGGEHLVGERLVDPSSQGLEDHLALAELAAQGLEKLGEKHRAALVAVLEGGDRLAVANDLGLTRANVDQIVSRYHRALREALAA
jgi:DNA-directed RNA polymerase specialized sigma24 family protein